MIRLFEFKNSFMRKNGKAVATEYSSIGYFDGLDTAKYEDYQAEILLGEPIRIENIEMADCDFFSMTGMRETEDTIFWESPSPPFLFVSYIRLENASEQLEDIVNRIEGEYNACCYYTIDSSDVIICLKTSKYTEGYRTIEKEYPKIVKELDKKNKIKKIYSIVSLKQSVLDHLYECDGGIQDEIISCYLSAVVRDWDRIEIFKTQLSKHFSKSDIKRYGILGSDDIIIEIKNVSMRELLSLYCKDGLLTHGNEFYKCFYNIKTEILVEE